MQKDSVHRLALVPRDSNSLVSFLFFFFQVSALIGLALVSTPFQNEFVQLFTTANQTVAQKKIVPADM